MSTTTPSIKTSTLIIASLGTIASGLLAYAVYFDYRRRHDVAFRRALKRESRKQAKEARSEAETSKKQERQEIRSMVDEANEEGLPTDADEKEGYFMQEVGQGEVLCQQSGMAKEAALCFFKALRVYPQPKELMKVCLGFVCGDVWAPE